MSILANGGTLRLVRKATPIIASRLVTLTVCAVLSLQFWSPARADAVDVDYVKGQLPIASDSITGLGTDLFGDKVNLYNGSLQFEQTDISIPGNSGLPVALARYREAGRSLYVRGAMGDWDIHVPRIEGTFGDYIGWRLANGGSRCTDFGVLDTAAANGWAQTEGGNFRVVIFFQPWDYESGINIVVPGQGSREILRKTGNTAAPSDGNSYPLVTGDNWQVGCLPSVQNGDGEGFFAVSPDGVKYRFDWMAKRRQRPVAKDGAVLARSNIFLMATSVTDRFGNWVNYTYSPANPLQLQRIDSSDGRAIVLDYNGPYVTSATDGSRTWQYSYSDFSARGELRSVQLPDNSRWTFDLSRMAYMDGDQVLDYYVDCDSLPQAPSGDFVGTMTHPSGASGTFTTQFLQIGRSNVTRWCTYYPWGGNLAWTNGSVFPKSIVSQALVTKVITGVGLSPMTWRYADYSNPWGEWAPSNTDSKIVTLTDPLGAVTRYTYGIQWHVNEGQLLKVEEGWNGSSALRTTTHSYRDAAGQAFPDRYGDSMLAVGDYLSWHNRPLQSKVISQQGVDFNWRVNPGPSGFDPLARPLQIDRYSSLGNTKSETIVYHDNTAVWVMGQVASVTEAGLVREQYTYHPTTAMRTAKYAFGLALESYAYHPDGTLHQRLDPLNRATTYNDYWRGIARSFVARDGRAESAEVTNLGRVSSHTNAAGKTTQYGYDNIGRLASVTYPSETTGAYHPTTVAFEPVNAPEYGIPAGHWRQTIATGNARTVRYYDALWRTGLTRKFDVANEAGTASVVETRFDPAGRKVFESYPQRSLETIGGGVAGKTWWFDALGRELASSADSGLGALPTITEYLPNFQRRVTNPRGYSTQFADNAFDDPSATTINVAWLPEGVTVGFVRDAFGKPLSITRSGAYLGNPQSATRSYVYDLYQRLCKTVEPETGATVQSYDPAGNVAWRASGSALTGLSACDQESVPGASKITFGYDARDRLTSTVYGDGSPGVSRSYTPDGLPLTVVSSGITWTYGYNNRRLLTQELFSLPGQSPGQGWNFTWGVDAHGNVSSFADPWGAIAYGPDALGHPTQVAGVANNITHHPNGAVASYTLVNGITHTVSQNLRGLPELWRDAGAVGVVQDRYVYDRNGNVASITDEQEGVSSRAMGYDGLDRLTQANSAGVWGTGSFGYDTLDNLRSSTVGGRTLSHNIDAAANRLVSLTGSQNISIAYDSNGNITQRGVQGFVFDIGNRLLSAPGKANYTYDGHGRRSWKGGGPDGSAEWQVYSQAGRLLLGSHNMRGDTRYVYLGDKLIAEYNTLTGTSFSHTDALGSPVAKTNLGGQVISRTRYEPYGATAAGTNPVGIGFTGHVNDADTGLVYMQQRYYDPVAGRFLSVDPVTTDADTGSSFNRYEYARNNPYKYTDPDGRDPWYKEVQPPPPPPAPTPVPTITIVGRRTPTPTSQAAGAPSASPVSMEAQEAIASFLDRLIDGECGRTVNCLTAPFAGRGGKPIADIVRKISQFERKSLRDQKSVYDKLQKTYEKHLEKYGQKPETALGETNRMQRELAEMRKILEGRGVEF